MSEVSYQSILSPVSRGDAGAFVSLPPDAVTTRRKQATKSATVALSKAQLAWLDHVAAISGRGVDRDAVVRALVDVGRHLDVDWALVAGGAAMRAAVRDAVRVRHTPGR